MSTREKLAHSWVERGWLVLALAYFALFFPLLVVKHNAFNTRVYDFARFSQAIWSTLDGKFLFSSIKYGSILGNHFSPIMALVAPLLLVWPDERVLFLVQAVNVAVAGLFLYRTFREKRPELAPWFLLAFYLNPALHEVTLFEVRRIVFSMPFLALALYALSVHKRRLMLLGLVLALLAKESVGFYVFMMGFYLLVFERDRKWGVALMALGSAWLIVISLWVLPALHTPDVGADVYPQLYYFDFLGGSYEEILQSLLADPLVLVKRMFQLPQLKAMGRVLLPLGLVLPFLEPRWVLICVPYVVFMFLSSDVDMYQLDKWYTATILPVLFAAVAVGWNRIPKRWERRTMAWLLVATVVGYLLFSPAPFGGRYDPALYEVTARDRLGAEFIKAVPPGARVASQPLYIPHLTHIFDLYHYPWIKIGQENIDYFVLDRHTDPYPFDEKGINQEIDNMVADPAYVVEAEADGIYLLRNGGDPWPAFPVDRVAEGAIRLDRVEVAVADERGFFQTQRQQPVELRRGQEVRVSLYWEALAPPNAERTVSVRIVDASGVMVAQHDSLPGKGNKPTSWWQTGWQIRDVYYLTVSPEAQPGPGSLNVLLYDTYSREVVPFDDGAEMLSLCDVNLESILKMHGGRR